MDIAYSAEQISLSPRRRLFVSDAVLVALHYPPSLSERKGPEISEIFNTHYNEKKVHLFQHVSEPKTKERIP